MSEFFKGSLIEGVGWIAVVDSLEDGFAEDGEIIESIAERRDMDGEDS